MTTTFTYKFSSTNNILNLQYYNFEYNYERDIRCNQSTNQMLIHKIVVRRLDHNDKHRELQPFLYWHQFLQSQLDQNQNL